MKVLIVEDVILIADRIADLTKECIKHANTIICYSLQSAKQEIEKQEFDLLLLDLNLNGQDGFELLKLASASSFQTIIITADQNKAVTAFDYGVLDFVTKPISKSRFIKAIDRIQKGSALHREKLKYLTVKIKNILTFIEIENICAIKGAGNYSEIITSNSKTFLHDKSLDRLISLLPDNFIRIHRSHIVAQSKIKQVINHGAGKYTAHIEGLDPIPISRNAFKLYFKPEV